MPSVRSAAGKAPRKAPVVRLTKKGVPFKKRREHPGSRLINIKMNRIY
jgi:hypothetical protein